MSNIRIVAAGNGVFSDIAIDSISTSQCQCNFKQSVESKTGLSCLFNENSFCRYKALNSVTFAKGIEISKDGRLISPDFSLKKNSCLSITYKSIGIDQRLVVGARRENEKSFEVWTSSVENLEYWNQDSIALPKGKYENLEFFLQSGNADSATGFVIKSLLFSPKSCFSEINCDFKDQSLCGYELSGELLQRENVFSLVDFQAWIHHFCIKIYYTVDVPLF